MRRLKHRSNNFNPGDCLGKLTLLEFIPAARSATGKARWKCQCECGREKVIDEYNIKRKTSRSCGSGECKQGMPVAGRFAKEYKAWENMKTRCYNQNYTSYNIYGGRGIKVCDEWRDDFWLFLHDMGACPEGDYSLDRINNDGDYTPSNCRWADRRTQRLNQRPRSCS